jgi:hypothetical protein
MLQQQHKEPLPDSKRLRSTLIISSNLRLSSQVFFLFRLRSKILYAFLTCTTTLQNNLSFYIGNRFELVWLFIDKKSNTKYENILNKGKNIGGSIRSMTLRLPQTHTHTHLVECYKIFLHSPRLPALIT